MKRIINKNFLKSKDSKKKRYLRFKESKYKRSDLFNTINPDKDSVILYFKKAFERAKFNRNILQKELNILQSGSQYVTSFNDEYCETNVKNEMKTESYDLHNDYCYNEILKSSMIIDNEAQRENNRESLSELLSEEEKINSRIQILKQQNLWFQEIIDKTQILPRPKFHWDFIIAEMNWLAEDFNREKNWKRICAKKLANAVVKALREKKNKVFKDAKQETYKMKKSCALIAKIVKDFWKQMEKIVLAKQQFRLNAKHQEAMTTHLGKVIETTEKYTEWLTEDLKTNSFSEQVELVKDPDFAVNDKDLEESDCEETIEIDEKELEGMDIGLEIQDLRNEGNMSLSDLLTILPEGYLSEIMNIDNVPSTNEKINEIIASQSSSIADDDCVGDPVDMSLDCVCSEVVIEEEIAEEEHDFVSNEIINHSTNYNFDEDERIDSLPNDENNNSKHGDGNIDEDENSKSSEEKEEEDDDDDEDDNYSEASETLIEQEEYELKYLNKYDEEVGDLKNEANIPLEEILKGYLLNCEESYEQNSICESETMSTSRESSSDSIDSISTMNSDSTIDLNQLIIHSNGPLEEPVKFKFSGEIEALTKAALSSQPKGFTIESADIKVNVPHLIRHKLREYQCIGLDWLAAIYDKRLNGILADEMGLGKTIQTIALLSYLACEKAIWGPHLIIVPTSVILNWEIEFKKWSPGFKILTYYGSLKERREKRKGWTKTNAFHVCITSYKLAIQDSLSFKRKKWKYLILDEAQNIKNFKSQRWQTLLTFNSQRRLLLTGTPLQNNLMELWSLMHFLMPNIFQSHKEFQEWFGSPLTGMIEGNAEYNEHLVRRLHKLLRPFILRRLKKDVEKQMPKKYEHIIMCKLSKRQRFLYDDFMSLSSTQETLASGQFLSVINILMQLRKVCNHPNLFETRPTISPFLIINDFHLNAPRQIFIKDHFTTGPSILPYGVHGLSDMALNFPRYVSERILDLKPHPSLIEEIDSISVSDWVSENKSLYGSPSWKTMRPFLTRTMGFPNVPDDLNRQFGQDDNQINRTSQFVDRLNRGLQILKEQHQNNNYDYKLPEYLIKERIQNRHDSLKYMAKCNEFRCDTFLTFGPDVINFLTVNKSMKSSNSNNSKQLLLVSGKSLNQFFLDADDILKKFVFCVPPALSDGVRVNKSCLFRQNEIDFSNRLLSLVKPLIPDGHFKVVNSQRVQFPDTRLIQYDCGKLQTLEILLKRLNKESHRCLIFTQMTRMLDILEQFLSYLGYRYLRLDGATKVEQRQLLMESFNLDSRIFVFILSTRSGGLGINLTGADTVIFYDSDWNPTMDAQAQDRCHRIGQTRDVHIYRLISQMTVEENILKKANQKRTLNDMAIEGGQFNTAFFKTNTLEDLFKAPSGLDDLVCEQLSSENDNHINVKIENFENNDIKSELMPYITTRSGRHIKWRGPPINLQSLEKCSSTTVTSSTSNDITTAAGAPVLVVCDSDTNQENIVVFDTTEFEEALQLIEEENDRIAAYNAKAEMKADLAEFDETIPWDEIENNNNQDHNNHQTLNSKNAELEKEEKFHLETERQIKEFEEQLNPIQRFGVRMVESVIEDTLADQLEMAKQNLESSKKAWHLEQLKALHEADEMKAGIEEDDMLYCYGDYDPTTQKKELERLKKEEAEFFKAEKRKIEEEAKQAKADAARKAWSRQQHLLAIKRKHLQSNNRFNKMSRTIKQNRVMTNLECNQSSENSISNSQMVCSDRIKNENIACKTIRSNHFTSHRTTTTRPFFPKMRYNNSIQSYYNHPRSQASIRSPPTFHLAPRPNIINIRNQTNNHFMTHEKSLNKMQSISLSQNQGQFVRHSMTPNISLAHISPYSNKSISSCSPLFLNNNNSTNINSTNPCMNFTSTSSIQFKSSDNINNTNYPINSQSSFQIPVQSLCNFRTSLPAQQLIINSQPVLFINRSITPQNNSIIARSQNSNNLSSTPMIQIINRPSNVNLTTPQTRLGTSTLLTERPTNSRYTNISIPNSQSFILPSVSGTNANIIRINCSSSNNYLTKPDFINPSIISFNNISNSVLRLATVTNNISNINGNYQNMPSNPMIIINNNNSINQTKPLFSTSQNSVNKPITVSQLTTSNPATTKANNLPN